MAVEGSVVVSPVNDCVDGLVVGLPAKEVHRRARHARCVLGRAQGALAFWLLEIDERKLYQEFGCSSTYHYAARYLDLEPHTVSEVLRTGRLLAGLPLLAESYRKGELHPSKAREITRVATAETQEFWLQAALKSTARDIERMVAFTPKGGLPPVDGISRGQAEGPPPQATPPTAVFENQSDVGTGVNCAAPRRIPASSGEEAVRDEIAESGCAQKGQGSPPWDSGAGLNPGEGASPDSGGGPAQIDGHVKYHEKVFIDLTAEEMAIISDALEKARKQSGLKGRAALFTHIARTFLNGSSGEDSSQSRPPYQIVIHHNPLSNISWVETPQGTRVVPQSVFEQASCDADIIDLEDEPAAPEADGSAQAALRQEGSRTESAADVNDAARTRGVRSYGSMTPDQVNAAYQFMKAAHSRNKPAMNKDDEHEHDHGHSCEGECSKSRLRRRNGRLRRIISPALRRKVLNRDGNRCRICGSTYCLEFHHIVPLASGGLNVLGNILVCCRSCHSRIHAGKLSLEGIIQQIQPPTSPPLETRGRKRGLKMQSGDGEQAPARSVREEIN
jgi:hypothetical protein